MSKDDRVERIVLARAVDAAFGGLRFSLLASVVLAGALVVRTWGAIGAGAALSWLAAGIFIAWARLRTANQWNTMTSPRKEVEAPTFRASALRGALAAGIWWAMGTSALQLHLEGEDRFLLAAMVIGLVSGALMGLTAIPQAYRFFAIPILAANIAFVLYSTGDWLLIGVLFFYVPVLMLGSSRIAGMMSRNTRLAVSQANALRDLQSARDVALASVRARSEFLAVMSHEIRTPLNGVVGMAGLLRDGPLNAQQQDYLEALNQSAEALQVIINDVLDLSKIDAGRVELEARDVDLHAQLESLVRLMAFKAQERGLALGLEQDSSLPRYVKCDWPRLRQILVNLLGNAIKFTEVGTVTLSIRRDPSGAVRFQVVDTGLGMDLAQLQRLFEPFMQGDASIHRRFGGTGLGLSISRSLVRLMGGDIEVTSVPGRGSSFSFTLELPLGVSICPPTAPPLVVVPARVLLVDDNEINLKLQGVLLTRDGHQVTLARNGEEALTVLRNEPIDLVLLDLQMPVLDGYQTVARVRDAKSGVLNHRIPVVALTASATAEDREACMEASFSDYLTKPVSPQALRSTIARWFPAPPPG